MSEGRRQDGKPFKDGNTREDGSYKVGKNRTPETTRFAKDDGRKRGRRPKGSVDFDKEWQDELSKKVVVSVNGERKRMTAHRAQIKKAMELASRGKERSSEFVLRKAEALGSRAQQRSSRNDDELIAAWLAELHPPSEEAMIVGDDVASTGPDPAAGDEQPEISDDQQ